MGPLDIDEESNVANVEGVGLERTTNNDDDGDGKKILLSSDDEPFPFRRLLAYADGLDWLLMALGTVGSIVHGMAQPIGYYLLGKALDAFGNHLGSQHELAHAIYEIVPYVWCMAFATLPAGMLEISCWMYSSERQLACMRLAFLNAVLSQDIKAFDTDLTTGNIITGITSHMNIIQDAIGEKLGHCISSFATFFVGIVIAFVCCWQVALLTLMVVPMILVIGATYTNMMNSLSMLRMKYLSEATTLVEQVMSIAGDSDEEKNISS